MKMSENGNRPTLPTKVKLGIGLGFCALLLLLTGILSQRMSPVREGVFAASSPVQQAFVHMQEWFYDHTTNWETMQSIIDQNNQLQDRIAILENQNRILSSQARRAAELEELYDMDTYYRDYPKQGAQVVGLSPSNWYESFLLDKGSRDGIEKYMPVLSSYGLAGHISEVYENYCTVTSVIDPASTVYAQVNRVGGDLVIVQGAYGYRLQGTGTIEEPLCMIHFVTDEVSIEVGDEIVTSTLGDIYPPGLSIGTVSDIIPIGSGYESIALIQPTCTLDQMDMVLIITEFWKSDLTPEEEDTP